MNELTLSIHSLWWDVCNYLKKWYYDLKLAFSTVKDENGERIKENKRKYKDVNFNKITGYQALSRMDKFCQKNPDIISIGCDDSLHTGSSLYLIPHESSEEYWGTSVLYIPQNGDKNLFFLYPHHLKSLLKALNDLDKKYETKKSK